MGAGLGVGALPGRHGLEVVFCLCCEDNAANYFKETRGIGVQGFKFGWRDVVRCEKQLKPELRFIALFLLKGKFVNKFPFGLAVHGLTDVGTY